MRFDTLDAWLAWLEGLHPRSIELGLERVRRVAAALGFDAALPCPVVTVAGTNGKGSSVALLEAILSAAGYRVATYTSPHLLRYNERVRVGGREAGDAELCAAFERVDRARGDVSLTYFEFGTLAALDHFTRARPDVAVLEVGMGGRLDAVNLVDPDVALVTGIAIDHVDWLGPDREAIGAEKAGIFRCGRPAVCGDPDPPRSLVAAAAAVGAGLHRIGRDFGYEAAAGAGGAWSWWGGGIRREALPAPALAGGFQYRNAAGALMALRLLEDRLDVGRAALEEGLRSVSLAGRFQCLLVDGVPCILDVAHNLEGAQALARTLAERPVPGRTLAVAAILGDKDIDGMISSLAGMVDAWYLGALTVERAAPVERLRAGILLHAPEAGVSVCADPPAAVRAARSAARSGDRIVVFGSFYTVGAVMRALGGGVIDASSELESARS
ncbi:MAG: bifunctional tetrahydrofolate synthase/dihydrofolate synthase [Gammaproteobacteria bacterium]|nr:bifunctional tetrahydrofolate synthase/dihydrofolate synthase [Gammaproteobacteria bacterium]